MNQLRSPVPSFKFSGYRALIDTPSGIYPYFSVHVRGRMRDKLSANILLTGEGGVSKTYTASFLSKILNKKWDVREDMVMNFEEYMKEIIRSEKAYIPLTFDEPQDALYNRDWQKDVNKALVKTMTSQRFRLRPIVIPIINQSLLDINIRKYLLNYHVILFKRGEGTAYKLSASQLEDKIYRERICKIKYGMMDINLCDRDSCLRCHKLHKKTPTGAFDCMIWRAIYERKKEEEINKRDKKSVEESRARAAQNLSDKEIIVGIFPDIAKMLVQKGAGFIIDPDLVANQTDEVLGISLGINRALRVRRQLEKKFPQYSRSAK